MVFDGAPGALSSNPADITEGGGLVYFRSDDSVTAAEPWALHVLLPEVQSVRFNPGKQMAWDATTGASSYNVYRGNVASGAQFTYNQTCAASGLTTTTWTDPTNPASGALFYYLVTSVSGGTEGTLGKDSSGNSRPNTNACPG